MPRKGWSQLAASTQKRYLGHGAKQGLTPAQVQQNYTSGASMAAARGHGGITVGGIRVTDYQLGKLAKQAGDLNFGRYESAGPMGPGTVIERTARQAIRSALAQGMTPDQIRQQLAIRQTITAQKDKGYGRNRWGRRPANLTGDALSIYWYH